MKSLLITLSVFVSLAANAGFEIQDGTEKAILSEKSINISYTNQNSAYSCSYAEGRLQKILRAIEATGVKTDCDGGIDQTTPSWTWKSIYVSAAFTSLSLFDDTNNPSVDNSIWSTVTIRGNEACDFNVKLLDSVLKSIDHKLIKKSENCWDSKGSYRYEFQVLKAHQ